MHFAMPDDGEEDQAAPPPPNPGPGAGGSGALGEGVAGLSLGGVVRAGPGVEYPKLASLPEGQPIRIVEDSGVEMNGYVWFKIVWGNKRGFQWGGIMCASRPVPGVFEVCK
jgi:hypothetical protein